VLPGGPAVGLATRGEVTSLRQLWACSRSGWSLTSSHVQDLQAPSIRLAIDKAVPGDARAA
jgi:hypothetical protein